MPPSSLAAPVAAVGLSNGQKAPQVGQGRSHSRRTSTAIGATGCSSSLTLALVIGCLIFESIKVTASCCLWHSKRGTHHQGDLQLNKITVT